jgi:hypothetical protein
MPAGVAFEAGHMVVQSDPLSQSESTHARSQANNRARGFVAENARRRHSAIVYLLDVRRANAADSDLHEQFLRADTRDGKSLDAQIVGAAVNNGAHGLGNRRHGVGLTRWTRMDNDFWK